MRAPTLIAVFLLYVVAMPVAIQAGQARVVPEVGVLLPVQPDYDDATDPNKAAFMDGLQALGYVDGKNIHVECGCRGSLKTSLRWPPIWSTAKSMLSQLRDRSPLKPRGVRLQRSRSSLSPAIAPTGLSPPLPDQGAT
jgi:hypothetical protein